MVKNKENIYAGAYRERFLDPAMDRWVTVNSLNSTCNMLREINDRINNKISIITSTLLAILSTYFLSIRNWILMIFMFILLEILVILQIKKQIKHRKELHGIKNTITNVCEQYGIKVPKGTNKKKK